MLCAIWPAFLPRFVSTAFFFFIQEVILILEVSVLDRLMSPTITGRGPNSGLSELPIIRSSAQPRRPH